MHDTGREALIRPVPSSGNMTGRGLLLVEQLGAQWGVRRDGSGKTVWCTLTAAHQTARRPSGAEPLDMWDDGHDVATDERRFAVTLGDVPTGLLVTAKAHMDNLVREFTLASSGNAKDGAPVPDDLARLITTVVHGFADARTAIKRQATAAAHRGERRTSITLHLPLSAAEAGEAYLAALDEADRYARAARLLTLAAPPDHQLFRRWYVRAVIDQLRRAARGEPPPEIASFEEVLLTEVRRLALAARRGKRVERLQNVTAALARCRTPQDVAEVVLAEGTAALGASGGGLLLPDLDGRHLAVPGTVGYGEELTRQLRSEPLHAALPAATAMRTREPIWLETTEERDTRFPQLRGFEPATVAMCAVPVMAGDELLGALRFSFGSTRLFDDDERQFVLALAALTGQTLQRTEVHAAEQRAMRALQRALLPPPLAAVRGWDAAAHYSPAGDQQVGGDFYEVLRLPDGRIAAVVGDVMGRGIEVAAAMTQIRSAIRAYLIDDPDPRTVMTKVDHFFEVIHGDHLVTVLYLLVEPSTDVVTIGNAGHIPPILVRPGQPSQRVPLPPDLPFGVGAGDRTITTLRLLPGTALVAFTDGLVERRGEDIDDGIDRVMASLDASPATDAADMLRSVVGVTSAGRVHDDDVTVLILRRRPVDE